MVLRAISHKGKHIKSKEKLSKIHANGKLQVLFENIEALPI
jgi:hypothetical protein